MADSNLFYISLVLLPLILLLLLFLITRPRPIQIPIKKRHIFITGGSSGIGLALAHRAASEGARVSILSRSIDKLEEAKNAIRQSTGIDVAIFAADVRDFEAVQRAVDEAGPIDFLVVNQGVFVAQELEEQKLEEVRFILDVNLMGSFNMIKAALPGMKRSRKDRGPGSIALMSSQAGQVGIYGYTAYSASKFGLRGLAEALQQEVIGDNIHVSLVFPPDTETPGLTEGMEFVWDKVMIWHLIDVQLSLGSCPTSPAQGTVSIAVISESHDEEHIGRYIFDMYLIVGQEKLLCYSENKRKPQLTSIIAASSGAMKADEVAKKALDGIKSGSFTIPCNSEGILLAIATAGLSPQRSYLMAFVEVVAAGILRIAALCFQWNWNLEALGA
ncbi:hypothetical protein NC651_025272 [Populus alba x Populus x berolinensis]|nr:hypothetical protein NC651_025272 [Populus alba x Populus x berolinensis]